MTTVFRLDWLSGWYVFLLCVGIWRLQGNKVKEPGETAWQWLKHDQRVQVKIDKDPLDLYYDTSRRECTVKKGTHTTEGSAVTDEVARMCWRTGSNYFRLLCPVEHGANMSRGKGWRDFNLAVVAGIWVPPVGPPLFRQNPANYGICASVNSLF